MSTTNMNPDLQSERNNVSFNPLLLTFMLDGEPRKTYRRRYLQNIIISDKSFHGTDQNFQSRDETYTEFIKRGTTLIRKLKELNINETDDRLICESTAFPHTSWPMDLHKGAAIIPVYQLSTDEQRKKWHSKLDNYEVLVAYAQTELGHGSHVRGLETTATYDKKTQEFIINSPTIESTKWWPGNMGKTANHALVMAQLYIDGKHYGINSFIVPLRHQDTHMPLPGITIGDIGPKFGFAGNDNGFVRFDNYRIPRENMLMRLTKVDPDGTFTRVGDEKLLYGGMLSIRAGLPRAAAHLLSMACTVAIRYSCVRKQSEYKPGAPEPKVLEYQTQQYKLFPQLATAYAYWFTGQRCKILYQDVMEEVTKTNSLIRLGELHGLLSGLKGYCTSTAGQGVDTCRLSCGGHGYSHASGIPDIYMATAATITAEGEVTVLYLQCAKFLQKVYEISKMGADLSNTTVGYFANRQKTANLTGLAFLQAAFENRAFGLVEEVAHRLSDLKKKGKPKWEAWNMCGVQLVKTAMAHSETFILQQFIKTLQNPDIPKELHDVLELLCKLYGLYLINEKSGQFLQTKAITTKNLDRIKMAIPAVLAKIRPDAVNLVDAFDFPDHVLRSILGRYDGNVYENMYKWAKANPLNKDEVHESFHKYVKPMRDAVKGKL